MPDQKRMLTQKHKGWGRVWQLLAGKLPGYMSYEYTHTLNDTHMFRQIGVSLHTAQCTVQPDDFDEVSEETFMYHDFGARGITTTERELQEEMTPPTPPPTPEPPPFDFARYYGTK